MLIAQLTDLHVTSGPQGDRAARGVQAAVECVNALWPAPAAVVITGDIVDDGAPESYARAAQLLAPISAPLHVIPGNHDDREAMAEAFGRPAAGVHRQYVADLGELKVVLCDSIVPGSDAGALDEGRLGWIDARLGELAGTPVIVAIHHPPIVTGITAMDDLRLAGIPGFDAMLEQHDHVQAVIAGHLHRTMTGRSGRVPVVVCPSATVQLELTFQPGANIRMVDEPPGIAIHRWSAAGGLVSHIQPTGRFHAIEDG